MRCKTCIFWRFNQTATDAARQQALGMPDITPSRMGFCMVNPPVIVPNFQNGGLQQMRPVVGESDFCVEHDPNSRPDDDGDDDADSGSVVKLVKSVNPD